MLRLRGPSSRSTTSTTRAQTASQRSWLGRLDHHAHDAARCRTAARASGPRPRARATRPRPPPRRAGESLERRRGPRPRRSPARCGSFSHRDPDLERLGRRAPAAAAARRRCRRPDGVSRMSTMWPDCSPPSTQPRRNSSSTTCRSPTSVVATSMPASSIAWWKPKFVITVTATPLPASSPRRFRSQRDRGDDLVAVDHAAVAADRQHAVAVAVEREADVVAARADALDDQLGVRRAAAGVDVDAVGLARDHSTSAPSRSNSSGAAR